ncbi:hypothetical protein F2Q70_00044407 [Brassica cretica]|uniref:Uncharacterized protein n=1 Tax=Brassica cretica TaxID=69181 RepID=A0A8S9KCN9_BRACR|nr:hypothetical protein F2Q70_00044407 [Brassica cretica]
MIKECPSGSWTFDPLSLLRCASGGLATWRFTLYVRFRLNGCNGHGGVDWRRQSSGGFSLNEGIVARWFSLVGRISVGCFECVFVLGFLLMVPGGRSRPVPVSLVVARLVA